MKRVLSLILVFAAMLLPAAPAYAALPPAAEPQYTDATDVTATLSIDASGKATIFLRVLGKPTLTQTHVLIRLAKKNGMFWLPADVSNGENNWSFSSTSRNFSRIYDAMLNSGGEYRIVCVFTFYGSTTERATKTALATY